MEKAQNTNATTEVVKHSNHTYILDGDVVPKATMLRIYVKEYEHLEQYFKANVPMMDKATLSEFNRQFARLGRRIAAMGGSF